MDKDFWKDRNIFITGHTGFKGSWLCLFLEMLGAKVAGYAMPPPTKPSLYHLCKLDETIDSTISDIRDAKSVASVFQRVKPEIVIHMAAQPLVRESYKRPEETYATNVMGTVNVLEAVRQCDSVKAVVIVTSDKCYENREWEWGYRETDPLGGHDPYSSSKACSELVTAAYRNSYFNPQKFASHGVALASARAGNVIGGGDWALDRLIPDCVNAIINGEEVFIRNPLAIRPWQHVLEPLSGYLLLAQKLYEHGLDYSGAWNFAPRDGDAKPVEWIVKELCRKWGGDASYRIDDNEHPHEARYLKLDYSKTRIRLGWNPRWTLEEALDGVVEWVKVYVKGGDVKSMCMRQIDGYLSGRRGK